MFANVKECYDFLDCIILSKYVKVNLVIGIAKE